MKISIIGAGKVGVAVAVQLLAQGLPRELVLMSRNVRRAEGEALDLTHAQALHPVPVRIRGGGLDETADSGILVMCASAKLEPGKVSRLSLGPANTRMFEELLPDLLARSPDAMVLVVSNPVDVLTWQALQITGLPAYRVFGTGTLLDSARFRRILSDELSIHPDDLRAYILGEHGESQFPAMSMAMAGAERINDTPQRREKFRETVDVGLEIIRMKGHTNHGIAAATAAIVRSIVRDERRTMPISVRVDGFCGVEGVCLSLPVVVGLHGVEQVLSPALNEEEQAAFRHSAAVLREAIQQCGAL
jgi:L-lactate dehydrogenase